MISIKHCAEIEMDEVSSNNNGGGVYIYNGADYVPRDVKRVRVDSSVTIIPARAFYNRRRVLEEVELHEGLVSIEAEAFYHCTSLKNINLPSTLEVIGKEAFDTCENLEEIVLPQGLQRLYWGNGHFINARPYKQSSFRLVYKQ